MNKPTIGRIVLYKETDGNIYPAIIVYVGIPENENSWVNLRVFNNSTGELPWKTSVSKNVNTLAQGSCTWEWPTMVFAVPTTAPGEAISATASVETV
jgi:hypothetical protein